MVRRDAGRTVSAWTLCRVRDELPKVSVLIDGKTYEGRIHGPRLRFPMVRIIGAGPLADALGPIEFSWDTIVGALNAGRPLRA